MLQRRTHLLPPESLQLIKRNFCKENNRHRFSPKALGAIIQDQDNDTDCPKDVQDTGRQFSAGVGRGDAAKHDGRLSGYLFFENGAS